MYEPAEDTYLLLDSLAAERARLRSVPRVLAMEIGPGSGALSAYLLSAVFDAATAPFLFACDINPRAAATTLATAARNGVAAALDAVVCDLGAPLLTRLAVRGRPRCDTLVLLCCMPAHHHASPPIVCRAPLTCCCLTHPTCRRRRKRLQLGASVAPLCGCVIALCYVNHHTNHKHTHTCRGLAAAWAGGVNGREVTDRVTPLLPRLLSRPHGVAYMLLLEDNVPGEVVAAWAAGGLSAVRIASRRAKNELLHVYRVGWP